MRLATAVLLDLVIAGSPVLAGGFSDALPVPSLTLPDDGPTIPMPPGTQVFGPNGANPDFMGQRGRSSDLAQRPEAPRSDRERRQARIDDLLDRLATAKDPSEADTLTRLIDGLRLQSGSDTADLLMSRAVKAVSVGDYELAGQVLDKIVSLRPDWAEAWNERATMHYLDGDDQDAMADISHVLAHEPRHFGALSGMGLILRREGDDKAALTVLRRAGAVNPQDQGVRMLVDQLTPIVEGRDL